MSINASAVKIGDVIKVTTQLSLDKKTKAKYYAAGCGDDLYEPKYRISRVKSIYGDTAGLSVVFEDGFVIDYDKSGWKTSFTDENSTKIISLEKM